MKCAVWDSLPLFTVLSLLTFSMTHGTPPRYSLFQGTAYSGSPPRQRNKNWCAFVVHKNVTCAVLGSTETVMEPELAPCPPHQPDCAQRVMYRTHLRPTYKIGYKLVTELEWRCCPSYQGPDCMELKGDPPRHHLLPGPHQNSPPDPGQQPSLVDLEQSMGAQWERPDQSGHPRTWGGETGGQAGPHRGQTEVSRVHQLEGEMQRLSQTVLDLQAAMTTSNANLRIDLQEDTSKMLLSMLGNLRHPQGALTGGTDSFLLPTNFPTLADEELQSQVEQLSNTLAANSHTIQDMESKLQEHDGQLRQLMSAGQDPLTPPPGPGPDSGGSLQAYIDAKVAALRDELMEGIEIKMADLKNSCEYKVKNVLEHCDEQETSYLSLAELLDSKETDLRKEIQELRLLLPGPSLGGDSTAEVAGLRLELQRLGNTQRELADSVREHNVTLAYGKVQEEAQKARLNLVEERAKAHCLLVEEKLRKEKEQDEKALAHRLNTTLLGGISSHTLVIKHLEDRVSILERSRDPVTMATLKQDTEASRNGQGSQQTGAIGRPERLAVLESLQGEMGSLVQQVARLESSVTVLELSLSQNVQSGTNHSHYPAPGPGLSTRMDQLETDCRRSQEQVAQLEGTLSGFDGRLASVEGVCGRLEPMTDSLKRIKDGLNKHVTTLWTCVQTMNATLHTHSRDINALKGGTHTPQMGHDRTLSKPEQTGVLPGLREPGIPTETESILKAPPVMESGEAGPPGTKLASRPPQGTNGTMSPIKGYAGAPGYPRLSPVSILPVASTETSGQMPLSTGDKTTLAPVFSVGLTLAPFQGEVGIIRFDKVLLNDGGHYDPRTGMFSVPEDGWYLISAVLTAQKGHQVEAVLSVANQSIQRLDAGGVATDGCVCGGSASLNLVLDLKQGQKVGLVMSSGKLAISGSNEILSSFSGVLLYPTATKR